MKLKPIQFLILFIAAEVVYGLPFHLTRFFRYEFLSYFNFHSSDLSRAQSWYGVMALLSYFPGGVLADHINPKKLISLSLALTGLGGFAFFFSLTPFHLNLLYGFWGLTTVLIFWSAMISFLRNHTKETEQGFAFGSLEFARGLMAAFFLTFIHLFFYYSASALTDSVENNKKIIYFTFCFYILVTLLMSIACWVYLPSTKVVKREATNLSFDSIKEIILNPLLWFNLIILLSAYCSFKAFDYYPLAMKESLNWGGRSLYIFVLFLTWLRPFAALTLGFCADKFSSSFACKLCFIVIASSSFLLFTLPEAFLNSSLFVLLLTVQLIAVFGVRGIYFSLFKESNVEKKNTGTASGFISLLGFSPELFLPLIAIEIIDKNPGVKGLQNFFFYLFVISLLGFLAARMYKKDTSQLV